jgi:hypothetical protein
MNFNMSRFVLSASRSGLGALQTDGFVIHIVYIACKFIT